MINIAARNVNDAFHEAMWVLPVYADEEQSRAGKVLAVNRPVVTEYKCPLERMLFNTKRNANPFFHVMEAMWMLAGLKDLEHLTGYNKRMAEFSDDGKTLPASYGWRWRTNFGHDQILWVIRHLMEDPKSRRAVIGMWDPDTDPGRVDKRTKDAPCNTHIYFRIVDGKLDMTVLCRSNDVVWGCYGANAVHMSYLQEFVANALMVPVGSYYQFSNNWHIYEHHFDLLKCPEEADPYLAEPMTHFDLLHGTTAEDFLVGVNEYFSTSQLMEVPYMREVVEPLDRAWRCHKEQSQEDALSAASDIADTAIRMACIAWLERKYDGQG